MFIFKATGNDNTERGELMYKYANKRILKTVLVTLIIFAILLCCTLNIAASAQSWYCIRAKDHLRPQLGADLSWIMDYDGYYIDPNCTDEQTTENKVLYLTFDVGYENGNVSKVLDILKQEEVPGAFFILGHIIEAEQPLLERMFHEGHLVCNHTAHHKDMSKIQTAEQFSAELSALDSLCLEKTGHNVAKYYRPPEGRFSRKNLVWAKKMGYTTVFWSFAYEDWNNDKQPEPDAAIEKIMNNIHNGAILLLHPTSKTNASILGEVIRRCKDMGYRFERLDHLTA
jgi:peptidoglycan-N-acetylmuramic acid deacetylase